LRKRGKIMNDGKMQQITQRYCARVDANVVLQKLGMDADAPPQYRCLSSHLCSGDGCENHPSRITEA